MPTIEIKRTDFDKFLQPLMKKAGVDRDSLLSFVKGEMKSEEDDYYKIEVADTNRPDLFTLEGIVRELQEIFEEKKFEYDFLKQKPKYRLEVLDSVKEIRPFIGAFMARGLAVDEEMLDSLIKMQEKLGETLGRKRGRVAIGIYEAEDIHFPVKYGAFDPSAYGFVPLDFSEKMNLHDILKKHPKGIEYGHILEGAELYPLLLDNREKILSFPPIINSREMGEVKPGSDYLFIEATGTEQKAVILTLNIIASALALRGANIERCETVYPYAVPLGNQQQAVPLQMNEGIEIKVAEVNQVLGTEMSSGEMLSYLEQLGYEVSGGKSSSRIVAPYYRCDCMHKYDIIEDIAIVKGYDSFHPVPLSDFTIGGLSKEQKIMDRVREVITGMGVQEIISNVLMSKQELCDFMKYSAGVVEIDNVMTESFSVLRSWLVPGLLKAETASSQVEYPHNIFEVGEVVVNKDNGPEEETKLAVLTSGKEAGFTDAHRILEGLMREISVVYNLKEFSHDSFIEGRCGKIEVQGKESGLIGEIHPEVLSGWGIKMPVAVFEINLGF